MILLLDNYDSFTYNLWDYICRCGVSCKVIRNSVSLSSITKENFSGIVLSPGFGKPLEAGVMMEVIDYYHQKLPMLGVCLGHQALGMYFGGQLIYGNEPMHGKISTIICREDELFKQIPQKINVVRYHSLAINLPVSNSLVPIAYTEKDKVLMAFSHDSLPIKAVQFHPEAALTEYGLQLIQNWIAMTQHYAR